MKILLINPNTSEFVTDTVTDQARRVAAADTEILSKTGTMGAPIISCRAENVIGAYMAMELACAHVNECDAVVLAVSFDSGLKALRELLDVPVVGMSEAAMLTACTLGGRFLMLSFGDRARWLYAELADGYGLSRRLSGVACLPPLSDEELRDPIRLTPALCEKIETAVDELGGESVILAGAIFAGIADEVASRVSIPVVEGIAAAVGMAETLVRQGFRKPTAGSYRPPDRKTVRGVSPALTRYYDELD